MRVTKERSQKKKIEDILDECSLMASSGIIAPTAIWHIRYATHFFRLAWQWQRI